MNFIDDAHDDDVDQKYCDYLNLIRDSPWVMNNIKKGKAMDAVWRVCSRNNISNIMNNVYMVDDSENAVLVNFKILDGTQTENTELYEIEFNFSNDKVFYTVIKILKSGRNPITRAWERSKYEYDIVRKFKSNNKTCKPSDFDCNGIPFLVYSICIFHLYRWDSRGGIYYMFQYMASITLFPLAFPWGRKQAFGSA